MSISLASLIRSLLVAAGAAATLTGAAHAQPYPSRPIEFNVHTAPGGGTDLFARTVTDILIKEKAFPQPIIVSNRPGGSGVIAFNYVKGKQGDPHVVLTMATGSFLTATVPQGAGSRARALYAARILRDRSAGDRGSC